MPGLGLVGAFGQQGLRDTIKQRLMEEQAAKQREFMNSLELRRMADTEQRTAQTGEQNRINAESLAQYRADQTANAYTTETGRLDEATPQGRLPQDSPIAGRLVKIGAATPDAGNLASTELGGMQTLPGGPTPIQGQLRMAPQAAQAPGFIKRASEKQQMDATTRADKQTDNARQQAMLDRQIKADEAQRTHQTNVDAETARYHTGMLNKPSASATRLIKVEHKDPATGRTVIEWLPEDQVRGKTFQKGVGSATETRLASAQAVNQTGDDIITQLSDPATARTLGVAMGRYSKLQDFIGNPPPEFSELAGSIESYALANMGVHGMRSAQGALQIKQLLDQPHTPQSLIAAVRGLNKFSQHFMENEGRDSASPAAGPNKPPPAVQGGRQEFDYVPGQGMVPRKK